MVNNSTTVATSIGSPFFYSVFFVIIITIVLIDILVLKKKGDHRVSNKEALTWTMVWIVLSLGFAMWLYWQLLLNENYSHNQALSYSSLFLTGYVLEKALAIDNIFVFILIFSFFKVPVQYQHRVLIYGVLGAIILRTLMVFIGSALVQQFSWILYILGAFLLYSGIKILLPEKKEDITEKPIIKWIYQHIKVTPHFAGEKFFSIENGKKIATPLFLVLILIELSDVVFAVDSIPAIFSITTDPFLVLTSNLFAVLGLRAMYFLLANIIHKFIYLKYGLAFILSFIGIKMLIVEWVHIPIYISLSLILGALLISICASFLGKKAN